MLSLPHFHPVDAVAIASQDGECPTNAMLQRQTSSSGVVYYASPALARIGVRHAFSTRLGGISPKPFDSLNLGNPNGCEIQDDYERIWENYAMLQAAIGCGGAELCRVHQVHGPGVVKTRSGEAKFDTSQKADAIVGKNAGQVLSVRVADCVPILIASHDGTQVAAVHAGWRGIVAKVLEKAIEAFDDAPPSTLVAAIGPCIGVEAFEVGDEVAEEFERAFPLAKAGTLVRRVPGRKPHVDLREAGRVQLLALGLSSDHIDTTDRCTYRDADEFFSHRRDAGVTGRMAALIAPRGRS